MTQIELKRAYIDPAPSDGFRILVDRLWPRGITKEKLEIDLWAKALAPSSELRKAWHHDPARFSEFSTLYSDELNQNPAVEEFLELLAQHPRVTFVYGAKNETANHAMVLREYLLAQLGS